MSVGMFSLRSPRKSHIQEANKHLKMLHKKIQDLEAQLAEKELLFAEREKELCDALEFMTQCKESAIVELKNEISRKNSELSSLDDKLKERDAAIIRMQHKCAVLDYIAKHRNVLEEILSVLNGERCVDQNMSDDDGSKSPTDEEVSQELSKNIEVNGIEEAPGAVTTSTTTTTTSITNNSQEPQKAFDGPFSVTEINEEDDDKNKINRQDYPLVKKNSNSEHCM